MCARVEFHSWLSLARALESAERRTIGRGSSNGGRGIVGGVVGCSLSGWHSKRPKQIKVSLLNSFLASFLRLHHVVVFLPYALRNCMRGPRSEFLTKTVSENRLGPMLFFPSRFFFLFFYARMISVAVLF